MIAFFKKHFIELILVLTLFTWHWQEKDIFNPWQRPIAGDAQAYYAYLPAIFIYNDLDYSFLNETNPTYYAPGHTKDFLNDVNGRKVNKTFPGVALLYAPFFFAAHMAAHIFDLSPDGYSNIYQLAFDIGYWFYFFLSLFMLRKTLTLLNVEQKVIHWVILAITLGTNITFFTVFDQSVTHIHNFLLVNSLLYFLLKWKESSEFKHLYIAFLILALIAIIRPTNVMVLLVVAVFFHPISFIKAILASLNWKHYLYLTFSCGIILFIPFALWKVQTNHWVVYSYGEEGFDFLHPHFVEFLFSYTKGWFTYTPLVLLILIVGGWAHFKKNKAQTLKALGALTVIVYVYSSWWCWYYGAGLSQRVMIDYLLLPALFLASLITVLRSSLVLKGMVFTLAFLLVGFNIAQTYQVGHGILPNGSPVKEAYWDNFFVFEKRARVYPYEHWEVKPSPEIWQTQDNVNWTLFDKNSELSTEPGRSFTDVLQLRNNGFVKGDKVKFSIEVKSSTEILHSRLVVIPNPEFPNEQIVFFLDPFDKAAEWVRMEFLLEVVNDHAKNIDFYFWNGESGEHVEYRALEIELYYSSDYL